MMGVVNLLGCERGYGLYEVCVIVVMKREAVVFWCFVRLPPSVAGCCRVWQGVAVCCSVLQCVAACCSVSEQMRASLCCSALQCVAVCCSVLQCVLQFVLQCVLQCIKINISDYRHVRNLQGGEDL